MRGFQALSGDIQDLLAHRFDVASHALVGETQHPEAEADSSVR
jgi:hypothetical protein